MERNKEKRWNTDNLEHETKHEIWLTDYDECALTWELQMRVMQTKAMRDKCGISAEDKEAEPNRHIATMLKLGEQLGLKIQP